LVNNKGKPGYCPYCHHWLGTQCSPVSWGEATWSWQRWLANQLDQLVVASSQLLTDPQPQTVAQNLAACVDMSKSSHVFGLAREVGLTSSPLYGWINHARPPRLDLLARICYHLDRSLLEVLSTRVEGSEKLTRQIRPPVNVETLRHQLEPFLNEIPPRPASQVAQELGVSRNVLVRRFPRQHRQLVERYEQECQAKLKRRNEQLRQELQSVLDSAETPPPSLREVARRLRMNPNTLSDICPQLCRSISHRYKAHRQARKMKTEMGLKQILTTDEVPPPSLAEAADRLGEDRKYLYKCFPELCRQVTRRRSHYQPARPKYQLKDHRQIRRRFAAILAAGEEPPPSIREVAKRLNCGYTTLRQSHGDLCAQLKQQRVAYKQAQISDLPARLADILAANESPAPSLREVSGRLGVQSHVLKKVCPEICTEILRRSQAELQAAKQQRKAVLDQILAQNNSPPLSMTQVAKQLNCTDAGLTEQFPQESRRITQRYQAYKAAEKQAWAKTLQAVLADEQTPPPTLTEIGRQLGHATSKKICFHFPELCRQIRQKRQDYLARQHQLRRTQLETMVRENRTPPPTMMEVARCLSCDESHLKRSFPTLVQTLMAQRQAYNEAKKLAAEQALQAILADEQEVPPALKTLCKQLGYANGTLQRYFPELTAAILTRRRALLKAKRQ